MPKIPSLKSREVVSILQRLGFEKRDSSGSHLIFRHPLSRKIVVVPFHGGRDVKKGTLRNIMRQTGLSVEEFLKFL